MTTFVLVHGSYQGGWIWQRVATRLRSAGHTAYAPTMDGCAERRHQLRPGIDTSTYVAEVADLLFYEDLHDVVLVGTSSGGMVVGSVAERMRHRVARLVLVDALALFNGERTRDIVKRTTPVPPGLAYAPAREDAEKGLFADLDPATRAWVLDSYTPHPTGCSDVGGNAHVRTFRPHGDRNQWRAHSPAPWRRRSAVPVVAWQSAHACVLALHRKPARPALPCRLSNLRGYGDSVGPEDCGENHINYSLRAMALDQVEVMQHLGYREFMVAGHDRGARTTARMCLDHPDRIQRAAVVDILPNYVWTHTSKYWATKSWHWLFMIQPYDIPERMIAGAPPGYYMERKLSKPGIGLDFLHPDAFAEYIRCFTGKTIRGSCEDYRACASCEFEMDEPDYSAGREIECPLLVTWGAKSHTGTVHGDVL